MFPLATVSSYLTDRSPYLTISQTLGVLLANENESLRMAKNRLNEFTSDFTKSFHTYFNEIFRGSFSDDFVHRPN